MRHLNKGKKFHRKKGQRKAFLKTLIGSLILKGRIETTEIRAKEAKRITEKMLTLAKKQNLASLRLLMARLPKKAAQKLFYEIAPRYAERKGGCLRVIKTAVRRVKDGAKTALVEFV